MFKNRSLKLFVMIFIFVFSFAGLDVCYAENEYSNKSYFYPRAISVDSDEVGFMGFCLRYDRGGLLTGIKVNKIELEQNGSVIASSSAIKSYSVIGEYDTTEMKIFKSFENTNGINNIDVVFYLFDKEVARIENTEFFVYSDMIAINHYPYCIGKDTNKLSMNVEILNADEDDAVEVSLLDRSGNCFADQVGIISSYYDEYNKTLNAKVKLEADDISSSSCDIQVKVNGDVCKFKENDTNIYIKNEPDLVSFSSPKDGDSYIYEVEGVNLLESGPFKLEVFQDGELLKTFKNLEAEMQDSYEVTIEQDLGNIFKNPGDPFNTKLYGADGKLISECGFLDHEDDVEADIIEEDTESDSLDYSDYNVFDKKTNVDAYKDWTISMNQLVDDRLVNSDNVYVIRLSNKTKVNQDIIVSENNQNIIVIAPNDGYEPGETYVLYITNKIKSSEHKTLSNPSVMEFEIEN